MEDNLKEAKFETESEPASEEVAKREMLRKVAKMMATALNSHGDQVAEQLDEQKKELAKTKEDVAGVKENVEVFKEDVVDFAKGVGGHLKSILSQIPSQISSQAEAKNLLPNPEQTTTTTPYVNNAEILLAIKDLQVNIVKDLANQGISKEIERTIIEKAEQSSQAIAVLSQDVIAISQKQDLLMHQQAGTDKPSTLEFFSKNAYFILPAIHVIKSLMQSHSASGAMHGYIVDDGVGATGVVTHINAAMMLGVTTFPYLATQVVPTPGHGYALRSVTAAQKAVASELSYPEAIKGINDVSWQVRLILLSKTLAHLSYEVSQNGFTDGIFKTIAYDLVSGVSALFFASSCKAIMDKSGIELPSINKYSTCFLYSNLMVDTASYATNTIATKLYDYFFPTNNDPSTYFIRLSSDTPLPKSDAPLEGNDILEGNSPLVPEGICTPLPTEH